MGLEHAILGFLDREPMTGYDLKTRCFDEAAGHLWTADQAQVYRTLERLAARRLVSSRLMTQRGKPDRRLFSITRAGRVSLDAWLRTAESPVPLRDPLLLHVSLAGALPDREIAGLLRSARDDYQARLVRLRAESAGPTPECAAHTARDAELHRMTLAAAIGNARAAIDWIDDCLERLAGGLPPANEDTVIGEGR